MIVFFPLIVEASCISLLQLESNARFVKWKDGSMQLLVGDEALDVTVDESTNDSHLFMKNGKAKIITYPLPTSSSLCVHSLLQLSRHHNSRLGSALYSGLTA
jgi:hypothetical protein